VILQFSGEIFGSLRIPSRNYSVSLVHSMQGRECVSNVNGLVRAVLYVRVSTEDHQQSAENQLDSIRRYAEERGMEIVATHSEARAK
jgi:predicted site-specific integrase-resolvase